MEPSSEVKNNISITRSLTVFPNPGKGTFTLNVSSSKKESIPITVTNTIGVKLKELTIMSNTDNEVQLDIPPGIYFVTAVTSLEKQSGKIVVQY